MIAPLKIASSHEDLFADRYQRLLAWSLQLTGHDRELAEDLLHDAFVQFTFAQPDLNAIGNLDGYLYHMLRNLHVSQIRREARNRLQQLSVIEYDSADDGLRTTDIRDQPQVEEQLRQICRYACQRKETATAASVLILRFFHGYYPSEIAQMLRTSRQAVDVKLLIARREARVSFECPTSLSFIGEAQSAGASLQEGTTAAGDLLHELRLMTFNSNRGDCMSRRQLRDLYSATNDNPIECRSMAHLVSCPTCLDEVNRMLGLPSLSERVPTNMLGRDKRPKGPHGGGPKGGAPIISSFRRRARRVFEHKPQELCVAVNGYVQASQTVNSELSELNLNIDLSEDVSFVEVFSEQKLRLLVLSVDELPPVGPGELGRLLELSDGRTLSLKLEFRSPWPTLQIAYHDPTFKQVQELLETSATEDAALPVVLPAPAEKSSARGKDYRQILREVRRVLFARGFFLHPGTVTAMFALIMIAALLLTRLHVTTPIPTAVDLLRQASVNEQAIAARTDTVLHRVVTVEELSVDGKLIARHKVEIWHSGENGVTARRFFDEKNNLVGGEWDRSDGRAFYHHGSKPEKRAAGASSGPLNLNNAWQLELSAKEFSTLIESSVLARVEDRGNTYVISAGVSTASGSDRVNSAASAIKSDLIRATLTLSHADLHAIEETLTLQQGNEVREFRFMETSFERHAPTTVAPAVFEPEPELLSALAPETRNSKLETASAPLAVAPSPLAATTEQEVEVLRLINQSGADLGDQVNVRRTPEGQLLVQGIVETDRRKDEVLRALAPVMANPAVKLKVQTVNEALREQARSRTSSANPTTVERLESANDKIPADGELRRYFSGKGLAG